MQEKVNTDVLKAAELAESLQFLVDLLKSQMVHLSLKDKPFMTFEPAKHEEIDALWNQCLDIEDNLKVNVYPYRNTVAVVEAAINSVITST